MPITVHQRGRGKIEHHDLASGKLSSNSGKTIGTWWFNGGLIGFHWIYPLVNYHKTMETTTGKWWFIGILMGFPLWYTVTNLWNILEILLLLMGKSDLRTFYGHFP